MHNFMPSAHRKLWCYWFHINIDYHIYHHHVSDLRVRMREMQQGYSRRPKADSERGLFDNSKWRILRADDKIGCDRQQWIRHQRWKIGKSELDAEE